MELSNRPLIYMVANKPKEERIQMVNRLGDIFINLNDCILKKEVSNKELTFLDQYLFQASSYAISLIHNRITTNSKNLMNAFLLRSLIECVAIIRMYLNNRISNDSLELLKEFNFIGEYKIYKKYKSQLDHKQFHFKQIEENFKNAEQIYKEKSNLSKKEFGKLIYSKLPFLLDKFSFDDIVKKYCSDYYKPYGLLSIFLHPNDQLLTFGSIRNEKLDELEFSLYNDLMTVIINNYKFNIPMNKSLKEETLLIMLAPLNQEYIALATAEKESLFKISVIIEKEFGYNTQSNTLKELGEAIENIALDKSYGFAEIVKCKAKPIFELIAMWNYIANLPHAADTKYLMKLITKHTRVQLMNAHGEDSSHELNEAFEKYKNIDANISFENFIGIFKTPLGFMPNKTSINQFVYSMIDKLVDGDAMKAHIKMVYDESQLLSHANGYMIQSNTGSFMEYSSVIVFTDLLTQILLEKYILSVKLYDLVEGNGKYKNFILELEKESEIFTRSYQKKNEIDFKNQENKCAY